MKNQFYCSAVHKNILRDSVNRSFTALGIKKLREALEDAKLRLEHRREITGGDSHE